MISVILISMPIWCFKFYSDRLQSLLEQALDLFCTLNLQCLVQCLRNSKSSIDVSWISKINNVVIHLKESFFFSSFLVCLLFNIS